MYVVYEWNFKNNEKNKKDLSLQREGPDPILYLKSIQCVLYTNTHGLYTMQACIVHYAICMPIDTNQSSTLPVLLLGRKKKRKSLLHHHSKVVWQDNIVHSQRQQFFILHSKHIVQTVITSNPHGKNPLVYEFHLLSLWGRRFD